MKRIAILCDGTWNKADQPFATNVRQMALMIPERGPDGVEQKALYFNGVGVPEGGGWLDRLNEHWFGGALGWGLDNKIAQAYLQLGRIYEPGDKVYVFGFSRGAYTARSLVGLILNCGLPRDPTPEAVTAAFRHYRDRTEATDATSEESMRFRATLSPRIRTVPGEDAFRRSIDVEEGYPFDIAFLGVWDTVGALGIPSHWGAVASVFNRKYRFHDTKLSSIVKSARHAVAIDEERRTFVPTLWGNLPTIRAGNAEGEYLQEWFAGVHGAVGGGGEIMDLSSITLLWMCEGAMRAGLAYRGPIIRGVKTLRNLYGPVTNSKESPGLVDRLMKLTARPRKGPGFMADVAHPVIARWRVEPLPSGWGGRTYRPKPLSPLSEGLGAFDMKNLRSYGDIADD